VLKKYLRDYLVLFSIVGSVILLDQYTKALVRENIVMGEMWAPWPWLLPYARLVNWYNTRVAFGMFQGMGSLFSIVAVIVSIAIIYYFPRIPREDWTLRLALGLQMGGALGNLIDRMTQDGYVTDFVSVGNFAVFNVADASITLGVIFMLYGVYIQEYRKPRPTQSEIMEIPEPHEEDTPVSSPEHTNPDGG
jgi:signal peptidase II